MWIDANMFIYIYIYTYIHGPWRFQPGPCVKPALVRPHTGPRSGRRRGCLCPPTHPPIAAAYCACCAVLLLRLPTAVLLSCYSYPQSLRRDGVEYISAGRTDDNKCQRLACQHALPAGGGPQTLRFLFVRIRCLIKAIFISYIYTYSIYQPSTIHHLPSIIYPPGLP
jgi:hypothetical protein